MVPIQRETLLTGAVFVCIVAAIFLFRELNNVKDQINQIGDVSTKLVRHANSVSHAMANAAAVSKTASEDDDDDEVEVKVAQQQGDGAENESD